MLMFLLADLSSMKPNCLRQPDDDAVSTVRARCALEVDDDEPVKSSRLMLTRCPEGASNNQGRRRLPQMTSSPSLLLLCDDGNRNFCSLLTVTWHDRSGWTTTRISIVYLFSSTNLMKKQDAVGDCRLRPRCCHLTISTKHTRHL